MNEDITIVIPVHNRAEIVGDTLRSIAAQTYRPLRVTLVDNGSTDSTPEVLAAWRDKVACHDFQVDIFTENTPGAAAARNRGLDAVATEYVMFFDSDDLMAPDHVERAMRGFHHPSAPDIVGWDVELHPVDRPAFTACFSTHSPLWNNIMHGNMATQRYAVRTSLVRQAGGWNPAIPGWNDIELGTRLLTLSPRMLRLEGRPTVIQIQRPASITGTSFTAGAGRWESSLKAMEATLATPRQQRWLRLRRAHLAGLYAAEGSAQLSQQLIADTLATEPCPFYRTLLKATSTLTAHRIRGALRIFKPLF